MQANAGVSPIVALVPAIVRDQPLLDWFDGAFTRLADAMIVPVDVFGDALVPPLTAAAGTAGVRLDALRAIVVGLARQGEAADGMWRVIVMLSRGQDDAAKLWRLIAVGLGLDRLRALARQFKRPTFEERFEVHADLVEGFVSRLRKHHAIRVD